MPSDMEFGRRFVVYDVVLMRVKHWCLGFKTGVKLMSTHYTNGSSTDYCDAHQQFYLPDGKSNALSLGFLFFTIRSHPKTNGRFQREHPMLTRPKFL